MKKGYEIVIPQLSRYQLNASIVSNKSINNQIQKSKNMQDRIAIRLQKRLQKQLIIAPPLSKITESVYERQNLLRSNASISILDSEGTAVTVWDISPQRYPLWLKPSISISDINFNLDDSSISNSIALDILPQIILPTDVNIIDFSLTGSVIRANTTGVAKEGYELNIKELISIVKNTLLKQDTINSIALTRRAGNIENNTNIDLGEMKLLATGRSNYSGSTWARGFNVRKALNEHVNNVLVAPGNEFSFNGTLEGAVSERNGWKMAKVIFEGDQLRLAPGGGICQASTTTYRAILNAGLPVTQRRSHSLYVSYYKEYGVGIDATIYPGTQDLAFINDTGNYLLIQAYNEGDEAYVNIYGTPDGRQVALDGPFFTTNAPENLLVNNRNIMGNEIAWKYFVLHPNGNLIQDTIVSRYKSLPSYVKQSEIAVIQSTDILHASAPEISSLEVDSIAADIKRY